MKDYECCRCGLIFLDEIGPGKEEILCPNCGSGAREVEDLPDGKEEDLHKKVKA